MKCTNKKIKELLPAYLEQGLDEAEVIRAEAHLKTCEDCRAELVLLHAMVDEIVPDPGKAFWAELPARIYREVKKQESPERKRRWPGLSGIVDRMILPRWAWATAAVVVLAVTSWFVMQPGGKDAVDVAKTLSPVDAYPYDYAEDQDLAALNGLDRAALDNVATWANREIASLGNEIGYGTLNGGENYLDEELSELSRREIERLSVMLEKWKPEV